MKRSTRIEPRQIEFVWRRRIPRGMFTVIAGRMGEGKSTLVNLIAAEVSQREAVILSLHEDPVAEVTKPRLMAAGAVERRCFLTEEPVMIPSQLEWLERQIKQTRAGLVIFDSALQHLEPSAFSGQDVRKALTPLKAMLERTGCALIFVDHLKKHVPKNAHPQEALAGAGSGLPAASRVVYVFGRNPKDPDERALAPVKVNIGVPASAALFELNESQVVVPRKGRKPLTIDVGRLVLVDDASQVDASQIVSFNGDGRASQDGTGHAGKKAIAGEWLTGFLMFGPKAAKEVEDEAANAGFSWATVRRAAELISVLKEREKAYQGVSMWRLPDGHPALEMATKMQGLAPLPGLDGDEEEE